MKKTELVIKQLMESLTKRLNVKEVDEDRESLLMVSKRINLKLTTLLNFRTLN